MQYFVSAGHLPHSPTVGELFVIFNITWNGKAKALVDGDVQIRRCATPILKGRSKSGNVHAKLQFGIRTVVSQTHYQRFCVRYWPVYSVIVDINCFFFVSWSAEHRSGQLFYMYLYIWEMWWRGQLFYMYLYIWEMWWRGQLFYMYLYIWEMWWRGQFLHVLVYTGDVMTWPVVLHVLVYMGDVMMAVARFLSLFHLHCFLSSVRSTKLYTYVWPSSATVRDIQASYTRVCKLSFQFHLPTYLISSDYMFPYLAS
jgi:hypothetical protein